MDLAYYDPFFLVAGIKFVVGSGVPTFQAPQGSVYINKTGSSSSTRMYLNSDGATTWVSVTTSA